MPMASRRIEKTASLMIAIAPTQTAPLSTKWLKQAQHRECAQGETYGPTPLTRSPDIARPQARNIPPFACRHGKGKEVRNAGTVNRASGRVNTQTNLKHRENRTGPSAQSNRDYTLVS